MSLLNLIASNRELGSKLFHEMGVRHALKSFRSALESPAYCAFLKEHDVDPGKIKTIQDFSTLPYLDKTNYIRKYDLKDLLSHPLNEHYTIERSSGYTGNPFYWPRLTGQDDGVESKFEIVFDSLFQVTQKSSLVINTFALGSWLAGTKFARFMLNSANKRNKKMTVLNVGLNKKECLEMWSQFYKNYDQTIIVGYNPFIKEVLEEAEAAGIDLKSHKVHVLCGGEGFSEEWRDYIANILHINIDDFDSKVISGYGAADTGSDVGFEYPVAIMLRRLLTKNKSLRKEVFGSEEEKVPMIFQYAPFKMWIDKQDNELLFTSNNAIPLVRYNLHDRGGLLSYEEGLEILSEEYDVSNIIKKTSAMPLPFVYLYGRSDGTIQVLGLNVYVENVQKALINKNLQEFLTGNFFMESTYDDRMNQKFIINCESRNVSSAEKNREIITSTIIKEIGVSNSEYNHAYSKDPDALAPKVNFLTPQEFSQYRDNSIKIKYVKK